MAVKSAVLSRLKVTNWTWWNYVYRKKNFNCGWRESARPLL